MLQYAFDLSIENRAAERLKSPRYKSQFAPPPSPITFSKKLLYDAISCHMFSWAPLLVMGPGTVYCLYPPLGGPDRKYYFLQDIGRLQIREQSGVFSEILEITVSVYC